MATVSSDLSFWLRYSPLTLKHVLCTLTFHYCIEILYKIFDISNLLSFIIILSFIVQHTRRDFIDTDGAKFKIQCYLAQYKFNRLYGMKVSKSPLSMHPKTVFNLSRVSICRYVFNQHFIHTFRQSFQWVFFSSQDIKYMLIKNT